METNGLVFTSEELEFLAADEMIEIMPNFKEKEITLLAHGKIGPFKQLRSVMVPLWLAIHLKKNEKCTIPPPPWMYPEALQQHFDQERDKKNTESFLKIPFYYLEIAHVILTHASADLEKKGLDPQRIRTYIADIQALRANKIQNGLSTIKPTTSFMKTNNISSMELNLIRNFTCTSLRSYRKVDYNSSIKEQRLIEREKAIHAAQLKKRSKPIPSSPPPTQFSSSPLSQLSSSSQSPLPTSRLLPRSSMTTMTDLEPLNNNDYGSPPSTPPTTTTRIRGSMSGGSSGGRGSLLPPPRGGGSLSQGSGGGGRGGGKFGGIGTPGSHLSSSPDINELKYPDSGRRSSGFGSPTLSLSPATPYSRGEEEGGEESPPRIRGERRDLLPISQPSSKRRILMTPTTSRSSRHVLPPSPPSSPPSS